MTARTSEPVAPPEAAASLEMLRIADIVESPLNPRKVFKVDQLEELARDIRRRGFLQPVCVRPGTNGHAYELVFGARRLRAGKLAGYEVIPAYVRELTDAQVLETQIVENAKRADISALEEAEAYERLHREHGYGVEEIAARCLKSKAYVYARMKLCALVPEGRKAMAEDKLSASTGLVIARIPVPELQRKAVKEIVGGNFRGDPDGMSARQAFEHVQRNYMLRLVDAPFDRGDADLVPAAGSCSECPKRTGNQRELFADIKSGDVCTDPVCYATKRDTHQKRRLQLAAESGAKILEGNKAEDALFGRSYLQLDRPCYEDNKNRTYRQLLKGAELPVSIAVRDVREYDGGVRREVVELVEAKDAAALLRKHGVRNNADMGVSQSEEQKKAREASKKKRAKTYAVVAAIVAKAEKKEPGWHFLARLLVADVSHDGGLEILKRRGVDTKRTKGQYDDQVEKKLTALLDGLDEDQARGLCVELALGPGAWNFSTYSGESLGRGVVAAAKHYIVDVAAVSSAAGAAMKR